MKSWRKLSQFFFAALAFVWKELQGLVSAATDGVVFGKRARERLSYKTLIAVSAVISIAYALTTAATDAYRFFSSISQTPTPEVKEFAEFGEVYNFDSVVSSLLNSLNYSDFAFSSDSVREIFAPGDVDDGIGLRFNGFPDVRRDGKLALWEASTQYFRKPEAIEIFQLHRSPIDGSVKMNSKEYENFHKNFVTDLRNSGDQVVELEKCWGETYAVIDGNRKIILRIRTVGGNSGYVPEISFIGDKGISELLIDPNTKAKEIDVHDQYKLTEAGFTACTFDEFIDFRDYMKN